MWAAIREVQIPLLAAMLVGACLAKLGRVLRARSVDGALGPTALFPLRLQRPVAMAMSAAELALGVALVVTAGREGTGMPADVVRGLTVVLFVTAAGGLIELRQRRPDVGCGCFGDLSSTPVRLRTIARAALLAAAAAATIGVAPLRLPPPGAALAIRLGLLAAEFVLIAALSPEIGEALVRLGYSEPCELRVLPADRTVAALRGSRTWRRHARLVTSDRPVDVWRELCWRYLVYPGRYGRREIEVVFAVYLRARRPQVRAAVVDAATGETLPPPHLLPPADGPGQSAAPLPPHAVGLWPLVNRPPAEARPPAPRERSSAPRERSSAPRERSSAPRERSSAPRERPAAEPRPGPGSARVPLPPPPPDTPDFLPAATAADAAPAIPPDGSLYSLLALSNQVPRGRHSHEDAMPVSR